MKGQTAFEFIMTYGWVALIVVIVAAALYALEIFAPPESTEPSYMESWECAPDGWEEINVTKERYHAIIYCNGSLWDEFWSSNWNSFYKEISTTNRYCYQWTDNVKTEIIDESSTEIMQGNCTKWNYIRTLYDR